MLKKIIRRLGFDLVKYNPNSVIDDGPVELPVEIRQFVKLILDNNLTMVSAERLYATAIACQNVAKKELEGAFVECGVWRGGVSILAAFVFDFYQVNNEVYLFDTFEGMTKPSTEDFEIDTGRLAAEEDSLYLRSDDNQTAWCYCSLDDVQANFADLYLLSSSVKFIKGDVLQTLQAETNLPHAISVLRLDTDWYASTLLEMQVLYPLLVSGGTLLVDDYGHWSGARKAIDEYFQDNQERSYLFFTDKTGRSLQKA